MQFFVFLLLLTLLLIISTNVCNNAEIVAQMLLIYCSKVAHFFPEFLRDFGITLFVSSSNRLTTWLVVLFATTFAPKWAGVNPTPTLFAELREIKRNFLSVLIINVLFCGNCGIAAGFYCKLKPLRP